MSEQSSQRVVVGKFGRTHGIAGWLKVISFTTPAANIFQYSPWQIQLASHWQTLDILDYRTQADNLLVLLKNYASPEVSKQLTNINIAVTRDLLPSLETQEYYWTDLEGLSVVNEQNILLGKVDYVFNAGANDLLVVIGTKKHVIPFLRDQVIKAVDLNQKTIRVDWDENF